MTRILAVLGVLALSAPLPAGATPPAQSLQLEGLPPSMQPRPPNVEQPAPIEAPDTRSACERTCDAGVASCFVECTDEAERADPAAFRSVLTTCQQPCSETQATCRAACE